MSTADPGPAPVLPVRSGVLLPSVRRDLADLNNQYLVLATAPDAAADPRCAWSDAVPQCLRSTGPAIRVAIANAPFALFELVIPDAWPRTATAALRMLSHGRGRAPSRVAAVAVLVFHFEFYSLEPS